MDREQVVGMLGTMEGKGQKYRRVVILTRDFFLFCTPAIITSSCFMTLSMVFDEEKV